MTAEHASILQAAQALGLWPSILYTQLARLEHACGGPLIHRNPRHRSAGTLTPSENSYAARPATASG